ncbi:Geranylgeranyl transferase type-1 subunit beta [Tolypocladium capitatum]|uniref:Geranylgeranyl transferase type-1 subunit beta n=1 Tax=Tolypocladium capitatum TaxID=45235 RepID=A0A2K3QM20_9HYPO|nr:Geranylgeranyl transferase type-1 subunit beta [Tolypocladium capitatum]
MIAQESVLDKARHVKYWQRCHGTCLPSPYTSNDSTRLTFAYFIVSALDLLSVPLSAKDRSSIRAWVLSLQHPDGGFCGSPTHSLSGHDAFKGSANLAATFFALLLLGVAAGSETEARAAFTGVRRRQLLRWLQKLQREDGSFGQVLWDGEAVGGRDMRHSYLASCIRWMLRGRVEPGDEGWVEDIDVDKLVAHIRQGQVGSLNVSHNDLYLLTNSQTYDAGYAYCGIAALYMLDRPLSLSSIHEGAAIKQGVADRQGLITFLVHRQFTYLAQEEEDDDEGENFIESKLGTLSLSEGCDHVGYNGRWNKKADTCYCWWVAGTLAMLDGLSMVNIPQSRKYILDITQHHIGGFSKAVGGPPDIYHSYLGLGALALMGEPELKEFDVGLCCSLETTRKIELARDGLLENAREERTGVGDEFWEAIGAHS